MPFLLSQALENLLSNAIEFSPPGGEIICTCRPLGMRIVITIADQGPGLSPEALQSAFTAFYSSRPHGTGLGLTIAQKIVTDHNGLLWVENRPTGGAQFSIGLPMFN
ncbi:MAG: ATP-binding protein [Synechococcaceae cyanobacterium RM1_1_27]|nr:ATP-binding protein [Synechococcaceae cyanobacterium RM1_1_27]